MNFKFAVIFAAILALVSVDAQVVPALNSLTSKIQSISSSMAPGPVKSTLLSSAASAYSRIASEFLTTASASASSAFSQSSVYSSVTSAQNSVTSAQTSASRMQSSVASVLSSLSATASSIAQTSAAVHNAGNALMTADKSNTLFYLFSAMVVVFATSFVSMLI
ncbi:MAG: hypothetical protein EXX96DRAFT_574764 [Benjaminiella poitrasii]|nr:MAG: hypothetical protein EXX96DRAFT_574764 [Benjaminiella poitrasii]